ncbi:MAG TPA: hypothetical protein PKD88_09145, partial [Nitrosomonas sp.]|nr:hypothetical protein [Nitrosomonas sp.]HMW21163.1 hypothetical protein [Nitrosomonas sp.]HMW68771.1 hypothetical protein [Nitrosomonas sp.]HND35886.1 hypothetical protein [Nitrosomonas sp.]HNG36598.1 hypothetical protein [Nitrosomonas sp.]
FLVYKTSATVKLILQDRLSTCVRLSATGALPLGRATFPASASPGIFEVCSLCFCPLRGAGAEPLRVIF